MKNFFNLLLIFVFLNISSAISADNENFNIWLKNFKLEAVKKGISKDTVETSLKNAKFLERVIHYDRKQPEFFEDTLTYIGKRATIDRKNKAIIVYNKNKSLINKVENEFNVDKETLLALWSIETNLGKHVGKMDIISSLATLSFDKRRSAFFTNELLILLKLIDNQLIDLDTLYGSWAGAYGNFQFMPSSIQNYAIDYDKNGKIELKLLNDSIASAANYINEIGWNKNGYCFLKIQMPTNLPDMYLNSSAKNIINHQTIKQWKNYNILKNTDISDNLTAALIIPDGDLQSPTYLVFGNYEKILKWNRSLRFALSVCSLANMIRNEI